MAYNQLQKSLDILLRISDDTKHTILIVDDEENNLQLLKRTFRGTYDILTATNGLEAIDVVKQYGNTISLIISDQKMPVMEGIDFFKAIRHDYPQIIKILLTGHLDTDILVAAINDCDLYQYILKPFEPEELRIAVENGIKKYSLATNNKELHDFMEKEILNKDAKQDRETSKINFRYMTLEEVSNLARKWGMEKAMAFDGGGSTSYKDNKYEIVSEKDNQARKVKSFLLLKPFYLFK